MLNIPKLLHPLLKCTCYDTMDDSNWSNLIKPNWINWNYFLQPSNYIEVPMYFLSMVFVSVNYHECLCPTTAQWQVGIITLFLAWIAFLLFVNKWPALGIYLGMFSRILLRFLMITMIFVLLLISFTFPFYMAFHEPALPVSVVLFTAMNDSLLEQFPHIHTGHSISECARDICNNVFVCHWWSINLHLQTY